MAHLISGNAGVANALVTLSGAALQITKAAGDGSYSFAGLADGAYKVNCALFGYGFGAPKSITLSGADSTGNNFTASVQTPVNTYTQLGSADLTGSDVNPLSVAEWTQAAGSGPLQLVAHQIECVDDLGDAENFTKVAGPVGQFAEIVISDLGTASEVDFALYSDDTQANCYDFFIFNSGDGTVECGIEWFFTGSSSPIVDVPGVPFTPGDSFRAEVLADGTLNLYKNGVVVATGHDTNISSGNIGLYMLPLAPDATDSARVSSFIMGHVAAPTPTQGPSFLGSIVESTDPAIPTVFFGTVEVVGSAPAGATVPYLGKFRVVTAPAGAANPSLGQVVVVGSVPAGATDTAPGEIATG